MRLERKQLIGTLILHPIDIRSAGAFSVKYRVSSRQHPKKVGSDKSKNKFTIFSFITLVHWAYLPNFPLLFSYLLPRSGSL